MYVRHSAWLNTAPEREKNDKSKAPQLSRLAKLRKDHEDDLYQADMPPLEGAGYLIGYLFEVGPTMAAGMGAGPVTHEELRAWMDLTGIELEPWEVRFLRRLSYEYLAESDRAEKRDCPDPWKSADNAPDLSVVANSLQQSLMELANL